MLARLCVRAGAALLGDRPPDGRGYWAAPWWDRDAVASTPGLASYFAEHRRVVAGLVGRYAADAATVLDVACGTGEFTEMAARLLPSAQVTGLDISPHALARAQARLDAAGVGSRVSLWCGDFADAPAGAAAGAVLCFDAIHHLGDPLATLRWLAGRAGPGGVVIGNVWAADGFDEFGRHRYGRLGHLRRCGEFAAAAAVIRVSGGRAGGGVYRTGLITLDRAEALLREVFSRAEVVRLRYHLVSAAWPWRTAVPFSPISREEQHDQ